jgi:hypothetical protein
MSPFKGFENATITFQVTDRTYKNNAVGNRIANTRLVTIKALLKPTIDTSSVSRYAKEIAQFAGADSYAFLLEGYLVEPEVYPSEIRFLMEADIILKDVISTTGIHAETGRFKLLPVIQSPFLIASQITSVTPIKGIFRKN